MTTGDWKISRWVVAPEMLLCFLPLTFGWLGCIDALGRTLLLPAPPVTASWHAVCFVVAALIAATLGPVGLISGFRLVALNRPISSPWLRAVFIAGPIFSGALLITDRLTTATSVGFEFWGGLLLLCGLPLLGAMHLLYLSSHHSTSCVPPKLASSSLA